jgi:predicted TIM-barrel fold metal-dependent hydrolase
VEVFKVHVQVGAFDLGEPVLDPVWGMLADAGTPVVVHAGSGPVPTKYTGPGPMLDVLTRHPRLTAVVAHMGAPEYREFLEMAERFERTYLDTTMAFTEFFEDAEPFPGDLMPRLRSLGDKVLLGSDFPTIPYAYAHQLEALEALGLGEEWLRAVCWENGVRLFGQACRPSAPSGS